MYMCHLYPGNTCTHYQCSGPSSTGVDYGFGGTVRVETFSCRGCGWGMTVTVHPAPQPVYTSHQCQRCGFVTKVAHYQPMYATANPPAGVDAANNNDKGDTPMADISGVPADLSLTETIFASDDDKVLIKARFLESGELTDTGRKALNLLFFQQNKAALVELAQKIIDEAPKK